MSLATTGGAGFGGGGGAGGLVMAHGSSAVGQAGVAPPQQGNAHFDSGAPPPPPSGALLGADLIDKQQAQLSLKQVQQLAKYPLVGLDAYADRPTMAYYPPKPKDPLEGLRPVLVGKLPLQVAMQGDNEAAHKTLRKYLGQSKGFDALRQDTLAKKLGDSNNVVIDKPHRWLGIRRFSDVPSDFKKDLVIDESDSSAIAEVGDPNVGVTLSLGTLDGSTPIGDDFDRVVYNVRLTSRKKAITMLPEEATQIFLHQAQYHVAAKANIQGSNSDDNDDDDAAVVVEDFPVAIALPSFSMNDAAVESWLDVAPGSVLVPRSVAALTGSLLPPSGEGQSNVILERADTVRRSLVKEYQITKSKDPSAYFKDDILFILCGLTPDGFECTAIEISDLQADTLCCLFGNFKVLANVAYQSNDGIKMMPQAFEELEKIIDTLYPDADGPSGIITYGTTGEQDNMRSMWNDKVKSQVSEWTDVPVMSTKAEAVAMGAAVLGAVSHGRVSVITEKKGKSVADLALHVQHVAPVAVGIRYNYNANEKGGEKKWTPVKTIFDFDRRTPAGPYAIELSAADCLAHRNNPDIASLSDEQFLKEVQRLQAAKHIPAREQAALNLKVQVVQKWTRTGDWKPVGNPMAPLIKIVTNSKNDDEKVACEDVKLELSLGVTGMITSSLVGDRESVVQATRSARNSAIRYYLGILFAVLFFGGFLAKSYWEGYVLERDTKRLLKFYKHVSPGSIQDGDVHSARYIAYKYRNKKDKLWKSLEIKYGEPVLKLHEYPDDDDDAAEVDKNDDADKEGDAIDLDEDVDDEKTAKFEGDEPDL